MRRRLDFISVDCFLRLLQAEVQFSNVGDQINAFSRNTLPFLE